MKYFLPLLILMTGITCSSKVFAQQISNGFLIRDNWDNVLASDSYGKYHQLIGTYHGFDPDAVYITGYNVSNANWVATKRLYMGHPATNKFMTIDFLTGNVGIGNANPQGKLQVSGNGRDYYVNKAISGMTEDSQGKNYLLLHRSYSGALLDDYHVNGKITATRGNQGSWNRKWIVEVNTASAYNSDRGSIISFNEAAKLVTLNYAGQKYLAIEIGNSSSLYSFSFTGYANNASLSIVTDNVVSNVQNFTSLDPITIQGQLEVASKIRSQEVKVEAANWPDYVFEDSYKIPSLTELETYIKTNKHLPEIPSAKEAEENGIDLGEMNAKLLKKIEEMTMVLIEMKKENNKQALQINGLVKEIHQLKKNS